MRKKADSQEKQGFEEERKIKLTLAVADEQVDHHDRRCQDILARVLETFNGRANSDQIVRTVVSNFTEDFLKAWEEINSDLIICRLVSPETAEASIRYFCEKLNEEIAAKRAALAVTAHEICKKKKDLAASELNILIKIHENVSLNEVGILCMERQVLLKESPEQSEMYEKLLAEVPALINWMTKDATESELNEMQNRTFPISCQELAPNLVKHLPEFIADLAEYVKEHGDAGKLKLQLILTEKGVAMNTLANADRESKPVLHTAKVAMQFIHNRSADRRGDNG